DLILDRDGLRVIEVGIVELGGAHQTVVPLLTRGQVRDVMEHEDATAAAIRAQLEPSTIGRKRIVANGPAASSSIPGRIRRRGGQDEAVLFPLPPLPIDAHLLLLHLLII